MSTTFVIKLLTLAKALKSITLRFTSLYSYLKESVLSYDQLSEQLYDHVKLNQHLLLSLTLMTENTNTASIRLTAHIEAIDKVEDKASVYIEAVEETYITGINVIEETREQDFSKRDTMSTTSQATGLLSILSRSKRRYTRSSVNMLYIYRRRRPP